MRGSRAELLISGKYRRPYHFSRVFLRRGGTPEEKNKTKVSSLIKEKMQICFSYQGCHGLVAPLWSSSIFYLGVCLFCAFVFLPLARQKNIQAAPYYWGCFKNMASANLLCPHRFEPEHWTLPLGPVELFTKNHFILSIISRLSNCSNSDWMQLCNKHVCVSQINSAFLGPCLCMCALWFCLAACHLTFYL